MNKDTRGGQGRNRHGSERRDGQSPNKSRGESRDGQGRSRRQGGQGMPTATGKQGRTTTGLSKARPNGGPRSTNDGPVSVGQLVEADTVGIGHDGEGVGRTRDGYTLFIRGALPGEKVTARVEHVKKQYGYASLVEVKQASTDRVNPPCSLYEECGGCQLQHLGYEAQLRQKRQIVVDALERIGKLKIAGRDEEVPEEGIPVYPTLGMTDDPWRYRNKAQVPIGQMGTGQQERGRGERGSGQSVDVKTEQAGGQSRNGSRLIGGFYAQGTHRIIDMDACLIQHEETDNVLRHVKRLCGELGIRAYQEETGKGLLRHVVVKIGFRTGQLMVVLVTNGESIPRRDELIGLLRQELPGLRSICQNINTERTNVIFGPRTEVLWGEEHIHDYIGDVEFAISARSFYQVNPVQTEALYSKALEYAALTGEETVIDAYCGIGTISLFLARHASQVYGVEIVPEAIADARRNARLNGLDHKVTFAVGPAEEVIPAWAEQGIRADVIVVDPPRKGCDPALLDTISRMQPRRVVYVSCNPATLARDLRILEDAGYRTVEVQPVDMFPHTVHVECCSLLVRKDN